MKISRQFLASSLHILTNLTPRTSATTVREWKVGQIVQTSSGGIVGHAADDATDVSEYLGIPYAQPPTGDLRFQAPVTYNSTDTINAKDFGSACMQPSLALSSFKRQLSGLSLTPAGIALLQSYARSIGNQDEDCLTLNVWAKPQSGDEKKAVMLWVHGGGWTTGSSAISWYNGQYFADEQDVIVVSFNYRLNVFGFSGNPDVTQNIGLLDQRMAVEWVRDNIEAFGGDPTRITLFGESVGAMSVDIYTYAYVDDPIVAGFIAQSGVATSLPALSQDDATTQWNNAASSAGCTGDGPTVLSCMRNATAKALIDATSTDSFGIVIDEKLVFSDYTAHTPVALPLLVGHNDFEPGLKRALSEVTVSSDVYAQQQEDIFQCPVATRAQVGASNGNPTWRYRYFGVFPNTILSNNPPSGAYHTCELPIVFGTVPQTVTENTDPENNISTYMRGAWAAFARDPAKGLLSYDNGWPQYNADGNTLIQLAYNNLTGTNLVASNTYDGGCTNSSSTGTPTATTSNTPTPSPTDKNAAGKLTAPPELSYLACLVVAVFILAPF